jgi:photosystem II stability/assembly factor-like uncharacterized protein
VYCSTAGDGIYGHSNDEWMKIDNTYLPPHVYFVFEWDKVLYCGTDRFLYKKTDSFWTKVSEDLSNKRIRATSMSVASTPRTHVMFVATDKGLYKSLNNGISWEVDATIQFPVHAIQIHSTQQENVYVTAGNGKLFYSNDFGFSWREILNDKVYEKIISLWIDRNDTNILFAGTPERGIYISKDGGHSWSSESKNLTNLYVSFLFQKQNGDLFCGTYGGLFQFDFVNRSWSMVANEMFNSNITAGFYDQENDLWMIGTNGNGVEVLPSNHSIWESSNPHISNLHIRSFEQDPKGETILFSTWGAGIYRSLDSGKSWQQSIDGLKNPYVLCIERTNNSEFLAGTYNGGLYKSTDSGLTWTLLDTPHMFTQYIYSLCSLPSDSSTIYCGTNGFIYKTTNNGKNWLQMSLGSFEKPIGNIVDIAVNPRNEDQLFIATSETGLYSTKNGGKDWYSSGSGIDNRNITSIVYDLIDSNTLYCTTFGSGVYISNDQGNSWQPLNNGLPSTLVYCLECNSDVKNEIVIGTENGIYRKKTLKEPWEKFGQGTEELRVRSLIFNPSAASYFAGTDQKGLYRNINFPNVPMPMSPQNHERIITLRPTLLWTETTDVTIPYTFSLKVMDKTEKVVYEKDHISGDQFIIPAGILPRYETYSWTVRAESFAGNTEWSKQYYFTIIGQIILQINEPLMTVNEKIMEVDPGRTTAPIIFENRTFLPIRSVIESFDGSVGWESTTRSIVLNFMENTIELQILNPIAKKNGKPIPIDPDNKEISPFILNERTMIPLRFVAENLDIEIFWNSEERKITLEYPKS